jgi:hypothetical protein
VIPVKSLNADAGIGNFVLVELNDEVPAAGDAVDEQAAIVIATIVRLTAEVTDEMRHRDPSAVVSFI